MEKSEEGVIVIGAGVTVSGSISAPAEVTVHGTVKGELVSGNVLVGESGIIEGSLQSKSADVYGEVGEDLQVTEHVIVRSSARVRGVLEYRSIEIEAGARLTCELKLSPGAEEGTSPTHGAVGSALAGASASLGGDSASRLHDLDEDDPLEDGDGLDPLDSDSNDDDSTPARNR